MTAVVTAASWYQLGSGGSSGDDGGGSSGDDGVIVSAVGVKLTISVLNQIQRQRRRKRRSKRKGANWLWEKREIER